MKWVKCMQYDLIRLNNNIVKSIEVNEEYSFTLDELKGTDLLKDRKSVV